MSDNLFWRNRIVDSGAADPQELAKGYNPDNWRHHPQIQRDALEDALDSIGVLQPVLFNRLSGKVIDGHLRIELAILKGQPLIPVNYVELTDDEEALALATLDAITEQAEPIPDKLAALLERTREMTADRPGLGAMLERLRERAGIGGNGQTQGSTEEHDPGEVPDLLAPFPYFGGKSRVAAKIWQRLGQVQNYVEPFCGSAAVLLACPFDTPIVTLNDADGFIANFWRAVAYAPADVAKWVDWPVNENDLFARHIWLIKRQGELVQSLETDPDYYDAKIAGWWCWGACAWIGTGWCSGDGPWTAEGGEIIRNGKLAGVSRQLPHLSTDGQGVSRRVPQVGDAGLGVNRKIPTTGSGVHRRSLSSPDSGVARQIPEIVGGRGGERLGLGEGFGGSTCEAITAHLQTYIQALSDKLRRARVTCGDWARVTTPSVTSRHGLTAILLDPPYGEGEQEYSAGGNQDRSISADVWKWAKENGHNPDLRIGVCGYEDGRETPPGWSVLKWKAPGGYGSTEAAVENSRRETIWFSPYCLTAETQLTGQTPRRVPQGDTKRYERVA